MVRPRRRGTSLPPPDIKWLPTSSVDISDRNAPALVPRTLFHLPTEIKRLIVEQVAEEDATSTSPRGIAREMYFRKKEPPSWTAWGEDTTDDDRMEGSGGEGIRALSLVSREFAALAQPFLWKAINLTWLYLEDLEYFVSAILPRRGVHVRSLTFLRVRNGGRHRADYTNDLRAPPGESNLCQPVPFLGTPAFTHQQSLLVVRAISEMPNLSKVRCNLGALGAVIRGEQTELEPKKTVAPEDAIVVQALAAVGDRLTHLILEWFSGRPFHEGALATILSDFPSLRRLELTTQASDPVGRDDLLAAVSSLRHLHDLYIEDDNFVGDAFAASSWASPLETLSLVAPMSLSLPSLVTILGRFSATLTTLTLAASYLYTIPESDSPILLGHPFPLPHLRTLTLFTNFPAKFLSSFDDSPLQHVSVGACPYLGTSAWKAFIHTHLATLKRVTVTGRARQFTERSLRRLRRFCDTVEVEFRVEKWDLNRFKLYSIFDDRPDCSDDSASEEASLEGGTRHPRTRIPRREDTDDVAEGLSDHERQPDRDISPTRWEEVTDDEAEHWDARE